MSGGGSPNTKPLLLRFHRPLQPSPLELRCYNQL